MKSKALVKLMVLCLVVFGLITFSTNLVRGMDKAYPVENTSRVACRSRVASNSFVFESSLLPLLPYGTLWPHLYPMLSPKGLQIPLDIPLVSSFYGLDPDPYTCILDLMTSTAPVNVAFNPYGYGLGSSWL